VLDWRLTAEDLKDGGLSFSITEWSMITVGCGAYLTIPRPLSACFHVTTPLQPSAMVARENEKLRSGAPRCRPLPGANRDAERLVSGGAVGDQKP
jgi:hypothetical protein